MIGINIQVPFELVPSGLQIVYITNFAQLIISEDGGAQTTVEATPVIDRIHIVRLGDTLTNLAAAYPDRQLLPLRPAITHSDGTLVTSVNQASAGETLTMYAVGLGPVLPRIPSGVPTSNPPPTIFVHIAFEFRENAFSPINPGVYSRSPFFIAGAPTFAGLAPGFVGLYQVNFVVPDVPAGYNFSCRTSITNLSIGIGLVASFDGADICVKIPQQ